MVFRDRSYSVLLVCGKGKFAEQIDKYLPYNEYYPVKKIHALSEARRDLLERSYDISIVNWPASESEGKRFVCDIAGKDKAAILLMVGRDVYDEVYFDVVSLGVSCIPRQISGSEFSMSLRLLCSEIERLSGEQKKQLSLDEKMAEIRLVNKAKWALIEKKGMSEEEAHKYIEKLAMDERMTRKVAAEKVLQSLS